MNRPGALAGWRREGTSVVVDYGGPLLGITALTPNDLRIRFAPDGTFAPRRSWAPARPDDDFPPVDIEVTETGGSLRLRTAGLDVEVGDRGRVDIPGVLLDAGGPAWNGDEACWTKQMPPATGYFGFGERTGLLDKRGRRHTCWTTDEWRHQGPGTDELYVAIPFFLALHPDGRSYGLYLDTTHRSAFDLTDLEGGTLKLVVEGGGHLDHYVFAGPGPAGVVESFTALVGRHRLPPRWALGFHQSRWGYSSADEVLQVAREYRRRRIPLDAVHLDIDHMDRRRVFTWDPEAFADPAALVAQLHAEDVRAVAVVSACVKQEPGYHVYDAGRARDAFVRTAGGDELTGWVWPGLSVFPDHFRPDVREWWGGLYGAYAGVGVDGFLNDMNEPAMHDLPVDDAGSQNIEPPPETPFGPPDERIRHREARNAYALVEAAGTDAALRRLRPDERPFLLSRAGFAGLQRYAGIWTGDVSSWWEHLEMTLPQLLNLGLSGIGLAGADIGGFFDSCGPELLVRWTQLGALCPLARNHSAENTARQEPWVWGPETEAACRRAIELRYRLLPYLYTVVEEMARTGLPVLRPLFLHYPDDPAARRGDQALVGRDVLLAPVVRPAQTSRDVYLPAGMWFDFHTGDRHEGPAVVLAGAPLDGDIPLFVRGGAVLPLGPVVASTAEPTDPLELRVCADANGRAAGRLYEDDGRSLAHERGESCVTEYRLDGGVLRAARSGPFVPPGREVVVGGRRFADEPPWEENL